MNRTADQDSLDLPALWAELQDLEDGSLAQDKREALLALLHRSPAARRAYYEYFHQVAILGMEAAKLRESRDLPASFPFAPFRSWWRQPWIAVAAVFVFAALIGALMINPEDRSSPARTEYLHASVFEGTLWEINGVTKTGSVDGLKVKPGDSIHVQSGTVKLELESGSLMVMQGPAQVSFPELRKPVLKAGWLWVDTGESDDSFEISTRDLMVKDVGTRFGVHINGGGRSEVHLLEGGVNVISQESGIKLASLAPNGTGRVVAGDGSQSELPLAKDPFPTLQNVLSGGTAYGNTVMAQNPSGYWELDSRINGFDNLVDGKHKARSGPPISIHPAGVNEDNRFRGFDSSNKSAYFPADENNNQVQSVLAFLDGGKGVSRRQGAMTFWIKQKKAKNQNQVLWLACATAPEKRAPNRALAHSYITASGHLVFSLSTEEGNTDLTSSERIEVGTWHHIGISWIGETADIYMDGKQVAHRSDVPILEEWSASGNFARFGKPTNDLYLRQIRNFHGWMDDYALWDRPLTPEEVAQQFQAAIGGDGD